MSGQRPQHINPNNEDKLVLKAAQAAMNGGPPRNAMPMGMPQMQMPQVVVPPDVMSGIAALTSAGVLTPEQAFGMMFLNQTPTQMDATLRNTAILQRNADFSQALIVSNDLRKQAIEAGYMQEKVVDPTAEKIEITQDEPTEDDSTTAGAELDMTPLVEEPVQE